MSTRARIIATLTFFAVIFVWLIVVFYYKKEEIILINGADRKTGIIDNLQPKDTEDNFFFFLENGGSGSPEENRIKVFFDKKTNVERVTNAYKKDKEIVLLNGAYEKTGVITDVDLQDSFFVINTSDILNPAIKRKIQIHFSKKTNIEKESFVKKDGIFTHKFTELGTIQDLNLGGTVKVYFIPDGLQLKAVLVSLFNTETYE